MSSSKTDERMPLVKLVTYFHQPMAIACDAKCEKAWGISSRPKVELSDDPDDYAYLADDELGEAPADPGTYEGADAKPVTPDERMNKWCCRECERCVSASMGKRAELRDFSKRLYNQPSKHTEPTP